MKIFCFGTLAVEEPYARAWGKEQGIEVGMTSQPLSTATVELAKGYDGVSTKGIVPVTADVYTTLESFGIKQLAVRQVGVDNQDVAAATQHGITLTNVASYSPRAIAEMGVTQAMSLLRHIGVYQDRMRNGDFTWDAETISTEIFNCTVGLIGAGHIGSATAQIYSALGAKVLTYDPSYDAALEPYTTYTDKETILKEADIISLHTPLLPATKNMIDAAAFKKMKPNAILINMSRGELVDTAALINALKTKEIAGAGLDTLANEVAFFTQKKPYADTPQDFQELNAMPNVIVTPHVAFFTKLAVKNGLEIALNDAQAIISGKRSRHAVN